MTFKRVIEEKGYPVISKSVSNCVRLARKNIEEGKDTLRVRQIKGLEKGSKFNKSKWQFLLDAPFKISDECCNGDARLESLFKQELAYLMWGVS